MQIKEHENLSLTADSELYRPRLFLPLTVEAFEWYNLTKDIEIRKLQGRFKNIQTSSYKFAELRRGYSGKSIFALIIDVIPIDHYLLLFDNFDFKRIIPSASSKSEAEIIIKRYVGHDRIIAIFLDLNLQIKCPK